MEEKYKVEMGPAQTNQLAKAIATGAEKGVFSLPKGTLSYWHYLDSNLTGRMVKVLLVE